MSSLLKFVITGGPKKNPSLLFTFSLVIIQPQNRPFCLEIEKANPDCACPLECVYHVQGHTVCITASVWGRLGVGLGIEKKPRFGYRSLEHTSFVSCSLCSSVRNFR